MSSLGEISSACQKIETDGIDGFWACSKIVGMPTAIALLITHIRRNLGAMETCSSDSSLDEKVWQVIAQELPSFPKLLKNPYALFYSSKYYFLDNTSAFSIWYGGNLWSTVEHAYQAAKFTKPGGGVHYLPYHLILSANSPHQAQKIGRDPQYEHLIRKDWKEARRPIMKNFLHLKVEQHSYVKEGLIASEGLILIEDSAKDSYWGRGADWTGIDMLGVLWMEIRDELLKQRFSVEWH